MDDHSNQQRLITSTGASVREVSAPATLIPSVLKRLRAGQTILQQEESMVTQIEQCSTALHNPDWHERATAARTLGEMGKSGAFSESGEQMLIEALLATSHDEDESVRAAAVQALGMAGEHAPVGRVVEALHDPAWHVREVAALTLGILAERTAVEPLVAILHDENEDPCVREAAKIALRQIHPEVLSSLTSQEAGAVHLQTQHSPEAAAPLYQPATPFAARFTALAGRWSGRRSLDNHRQEEEDGDDTIEPSSLDGDASPGRPLPQPVGVTPRRPDRSRRIAEGTLAVLLIVGIALSWLALARAFRLTAPGSSTRPARTPLASSTVYPQWSGSNVNITMVNGVMYVGATNAVSALRTSDGALLWRYKTDGAAGDTPPLLVNGILYVSPIPWNTGTSSVYALRASDGRLLWRYTRTRNSMVYPTVVVNGVAYIASGDGRISALRASDGTALWNMSLTGTVYRPALLVNGILYVNASADKGPGYLYALRASDGRLLWRYTIQGFVYSAGIPPTVVDGIAYVTSDNGVVALRASDGRLLWRYAPAATGFGALVGVSNGIVFATGTPLPTQPTSNGGYRLRTLPGAENRPFKVAGPTTLHALRISDGTLLWRYTMSNATSSATLLSLIDGTVYLSISTTTQSYVSALRASDGVVLWRDKTLNAPSGTTLLSLIDGIMYLNIRTDTWGYVSALRASDGRLLWRFTTDSVDAASDEFANTISVAGGVAYIGADGAFFALRVSDGSLLWHAQLLGTVSTTPILLGGSLYVGTTSGIIYALRVNDGRLLWRNLDHVNT